MNRALPLIHHHKHGSIIQTPGLSFKTPKREIGSDGGVNRNTHIYISTNSKYCTKTITLKKTYTKSGHVENAFVFLRFGMQIEVYVHPNLNLARAFSAAVLEWRFWRSFLGPQNQLA